MRFDYPLFLRSSLLRASVVVLALLAASSVAGAAPQSWGRLLGTDLNEHAYDVVDDGAGGVVVTGGTSGDLALPNQGNWDFFIARYSSTGDLLWIRQLGTLTTDWGTSVIQDGSGGFFVAGETWGSLAGVQAGSGDAFVAHYDGAGTLLWIDQYGDSNTQIEVRLASDGAGGVFLASTSGTHLGNDREIRIQRLDGLGNVSWIQGLGSSQADVLGDIVADGAGGAYLCGRTGGDLAGANSGGFDGWVAQIDGTGALQWVFQDGTSEDDRFERIVVDGPDRVFVAGASHGDFGGANGGKGDTIVARYDTSGNQLWAHQVSLPGEELARGLARDGFGGVFVGWESVGLLWFPGLGEVMVTQLRDDGSTTWEFQTFAPSGDYGGVVCEVEPGRVALAGLTTGPLFGQPYSGNTDAFVAVLEGCAAGPPVAYCPASVNSTGAAAQLASQGSTLIASNDLELLVTNAPPGNTGIVILATQQAQMPFGDGTLCVGGSVFRFLPPLSISPQGETALAIDFLEPSQPATLITPGSMWNFQFWFRDLASTGAGFNLSNGLSVSFCP